MSGRIYDPTLGRFLQADPHIQAPNNSQNYNRYSYVLNNPMSYNDPSGFFFKSLFKALAKVPILNTAVQIGIGIACGPAAAACMAAYSAAQTYALTGSVSGALKAGAISYATSSAFKAVGGKYTGKGGFFDAGVKNGFRHIVSHAMVGGVSSVLQGGKFGHGFFSAGVTKGLTPQFEGIGKGNFDVAGYDVAEATIAGVLGGTISKATGGKFANGAVTAAMGNLFNNQRERFKDQKDLMSLTNGKSVKDYLEERLQGIDVTANQKVVIGNVELTQEDISLILSLNKTPLQIEIGSDGNFETSLTRRETLKSYCVSEYQYVLY